MPKKNNRLDTPITTIVQHEIQQQPAPMKCTITKIYNDHNHVDVLTDNGILKYAETIGNNLTIGNTGVVIFLNQSFDEYIIITK